MNAKDEKYIENKIISIQFFLCVYEKRASALFLGYSYFLSILSLVILINSILIKNGVVVLFNEGFKVEECQTLLSCEQSC